MAGYPPSCVAYMETFQRLTYCDELGPAKDSMKQGFDATVEAWKVFAETKDPATRKAWDEGCRAGADGLKQTAAAMGCAL